MDEPELRMRCIEAVINTDVTVDIPAIIERAVTLFAYVQTGKVPEVDREDG